MQVGSARGSSVLRIRAQDVPQVVNVDGVQIRKISTPNKPLRITST